MPDLRPAQGIFKKIWYLPDLFSGSRLKGDVARCDKIKLVMD